MAPKGLGATGAGLNLTDGEKAWLQAHRHVRVRVSSKYPPFIFLDDTNAPRGMGYDYLKVVARRLGLRISFTRPMTWTEALENFKGNRGIDLQPVMVRDPEREAFVAFTRDYLSFPLVLFARKGAAFVAGLEDLAGKSVAVEKGYVYEKWLGRDFPAVKRLIFPNSEAALKAVAAGRADAYVGNLAVGSYFIEKKGLANIKVAAPTPYGPAGLAMGVRRDWPELAVMIDKVLASMTRAEHAAIRSRWLSVRYEYGISPAQVLRWGLGAGGGVLAVFLLILAWNRRLKREVAERVLAQAALKENEERFRQLTENIEEVFWIVSPDWKQMLYISPAYEKIWGRTCQSLYDRPGSWQEAIVAPDRDAVAGYLAEKREGDLAEIVFPEYRIERCDGAIRWILARGFPVHGDNGKVLRIVGIAEDVTARIDADARRIEHLSFLENLEKIDRAIRRAIDLDRMMARALETLLEVFKADRAWLLFPCDPNAPSWTVPMECTRPKFPGAFASGLEIPMVPETRDICRAALDADGPVRYDPGSGRAQPSVSRAQFAVRSQILQAIYPKVGAPWVCGMHQCSHERTWTEEEERLFKEIGRRIADALSGLLILKDLRESEANYRELYEESRKAADLSRSLLHSSADAIIQYDMKGRVVFVSPAFTEMFGWTLAEVAGKPLDFVPEPEKDASMKIVRQLIDTGTPCSGFESRRITKEGDILTVSISGSRYHDHEGKPAGMLSIVRDISETKRLEAQFQQSQRLEAIGTLAGGIAHDFNNLLMGIQGRCSLMMATADPKSEGFEHLQGIESYVKNAADLTRQLLGFARGGRYEVEPTDLNRLVKGQNRMFGRTRKEITIRGKYEKRLWPVDVDRGQFRQVLLNFYLNAWQAMPGGGRLYLATENAFLEEHETRPHDAAPGRYVRITITDTGVGMDDETRRRIFEPFFTTKEMGRGTGLGLASAYGIVKNHGGFITVLSEPDAGTTFTLFLPASEKAVSEEKQQPGAIIRGKGRILLVDDEAMIIDVGGRMLERLGYQVVTAGSGTRALELYRKDGERIDLVVLDMIMPEMGGSETFDRLKGINPGVRVLLSSGYSIDGRAEKILDRGCRGFIQKPFDMEQLSAKIREALGLE